MEPHVYYPVPFTTGLWAHRTRKTLFGLCVDNFCVICFSKYDADHVINYLRKHQAVSTDWQGRNYLGLEIDWNYKEVYVDILIPEYVTKALECLQHPEPKRPQYAPHLWTVTAYGKRLHMAPAPYESELINKKSTCCTLISIALLG